jgi:hypothetical protein
LTRSAPAGSSIALAKRERTRTSGSVSSVPRQIPWRRDSCRRVAVSRHRHRRNDLA